MQYTVLYDVLVHFTKYSPFLVATSPRRSITPGIDRIDPRTVWRGCISVNFHGFLLAGFLLCRDHTNLRNGTPPWQSIVDKKQILILTAMKQILHENVKNATDNLLRLSIKAVYCPVNTVHNIKKKKIICHSKIS